MKKSIIILLNVASLVLICDAIKFVSSIFNFLLTGALPWTSVILSPDQMLVVMTILIALFIVKFIITPILKRVTKEAPKTRKLSRA